MRVDMVYVRVYPMHRNAIARLSTAADDVCLGIGMSMGMGMGKGVRVGVMNLLIVPLDHARSGGRKRPTYPARG